MKESLFDVLLELLNFRPAPAPQCLVVAMLPPRELAARDGVSDFERLMMAGILGVGTSASKREHYGLL
jgi:hypothetical protein